MAVSWDLNRGLAGMFGQWSNDRHKAIDDQAEFERQEKVATANMKRDQEMYSWKAKRTSDAQAAEQENRRTTAPAWLKGPELDRYVLSGQLPSQTTDEKITEGRALRGAEDADKAAAWDTWQKNNPGITKGSPQWHKAASEHGQITGGTDPKQVALDTANLSFDVKLQTFERMVAERDIDPNGAEAQSYWKQIFDVQGKSNGMKPPTASDWRQANKDAKDYGEKQKETITEDDIAAKQAEVFDRDEKKISEAQAAKLITRDHEAKYMSDVVSDWNNQMGGGTDTTSEPEVPFSVQQDGAIAAGLADKEPEDSARAKIATLKQQDPEKGKRVEKLYEQALRVKSQQQATSGLAGYEDAQGYTAPPKVATVPDPNRPKSLYQRGAEQVRPEVYTDEGLTPEEHNRRAKARRRNQ